MAGDPMERMADALDAISQRLGALEARIARLEAWRWGVGGIEQNQPGARAAEEPPGMGPAELESLLAEKNALLEEKEKLETVETAAEGKTQPAHEPSAGEPAIISPPPQPTPEPLELKPPEPPHRAPPIQPVQPISAPAADATAPGREERVSAYISRIRREAPEPQAPEQAGHPAKRMSRETKIGTTWTALAGGMIVLVGILFFLKYAWDQGWLNPSPLTRVLAAMAAGAVLMAAGEWVHRKKMAILSAALNGAGLAIIMAAFFAAHTLFTPPVFSQTTAFAGVLVTGLVGILLALHVNQMALAILALLGMYLSPAILGGKTDGSLALMVYLGVVGATGLGVSLMRPRWHAVRWVALAGLWLWTLLWATVSFGDQHPVLGIVCCAVFMAIGIAEALATLRRYWDKLEGLPRILLEGQISVALFVNVGAALAAVWALFARTGMEGLWAVPLALGAVVAPLIFATPSRTFSVAATVLSTGLFTLAVPLYFGGVAITWAWATMSLALAAFSLKTGNRTARAWSYALMWLLVGRVVTFDMLDDALANTFFRIPHHRQAIAWWVAETWIVAAFSLALSWLLRVRATRSGQWALVERRFAKVARLVGASVFAIGALRTLGDGSETALAHVLVLGGLAWWLADPVIKYIASGLLAITVARIFLADSVEPQMHRQLFVIWRQAITPWLLVAWAAAIVAEVLAWLAHLRPSRDEPAYVRCNAIAGTLVFALAGALQLQSGSELAIGHVLILGAIAVLAASPLLRVVALGVLTLVVFRVLFIEPAEPGLRDPLFALFGHAVSRWLVLAWLTAIIAQALALSARWREDDGDSPRGLAHTLPSVLAALLSTVCFLGASGQEYTSFSALTLATAIWTYALLGLGRLFPRMGYQKQVALLVLGLAFKWAILDGIGALLNGMDTPGTPIANLFTLNAALIGGLLWFAPPGWDARNISLRPARAWAIAILAFLWLNIETLRTVDYLMAGLTAWIGSPWIVKNVALSVLWAIIGFGFVIIGFARNVALQRWVGLSLLGVTVAKVILVDMANVQTILRVLAFVVVGLVLLAVSFVYHQHIAQDKTPAEKL